MAKPAISLATDWHLANTVALPPLLENWLLEPGSLTARLKSRARDFKLQVMQQQQQELPVFLQPLLPEIKIAQCREVLMSCNSLPCVYAQSWLPLQALSALQPLAELGEQPLGEVIFQQKNVARGVVEVARVKLHQPLAATVTSGEYWARRSIFTLAGQSLLVAEVFLDGILAL